MRKPEESNRVPGGRLLGATVFWTALAITATIISFSGCGGGDGDDIPPTSREALESSTYLTQATDSGLVTFADGHAMAGAEGVEFDLLTTAEGDLDFDGEPDAAAVVVETNGAARLLQLHALLNDGDVAEDVSARLIGDRVRVRHLSIEDGMIRVDLVIRKPGEPVTVEPSVTLPAFFALTQRGLTPIVETRVAEANDASGPDDAPGDADEDLTLSSREWLLSAFEMGDWSADLESLDRVPSLRFIVELADVAGASGQLSGYAGCNRIFGSFRAEETATLRVSGLAATRRACRGPEGDLEKRFLSAFGSANAFEIEGGQLTVTGTGVTLRFEPGGRLVGVETEVRDPEPDPQDTPKGTSRRRRT